MTSPMKQQQLSSRSPTPILGRHPLCNGKMIDSPPGTLAVDLWEAQSTALVRVGALVNLSTFRHAKGWSLQRLSRATAAARVFYVLVDGEVYFPSFFADPRFEGLALDAVCTFLDAASREHGVQLSGEAKFEFLCTPNETLGGLSPLDAVELAEVRPVLQAIEQMVSRWRKAAGGRQVRPTPPARTSRA